MGFLSRLRGKKKGNASSSSKARVAAKTSTTRAVQPEQAPVTRPPPESREPSQEKEAWKPVHHPPIYVTEPPSAREAAFGGPPRFDWIDIVSSKYRRLLSST